MRTTIFYAVYTVFFAAFGHAQNYIGAFSNDNKLWGFTDQFGNEVIAPKYTKPTEVSEDGLACVYHPSERKFKIINMSDSEIPTGFPNFEVMGYKEQGFTDNCMRVKVKRKYGVIDNTGKTVHPPEYDKVTRFFGGFAFGLKGTTWFVLKNDGSRIEIREKIKDIKRFREGLAPFVKPDGKHGFLNDKGEIVIAAQFEGAGYFSSGLAWVRNAEKKVGFIDKTGKWGIEPKYDMVKEFDSEAERTIARAGGQFYILKKDGTEITVQNATRLKAFNNGIAEAQSGEKWGFVDKDGNWIVEAKYDKLQYFVNGYGRVRLNGLWGVVDKKGNLVIEPEYVQIEEFFDGRAAYNPGGKKGWGFVDTEGTIIVEAKYDSVRNFRGGLARVKKGMFWGIIDVSGKELFEPKFVRLNDFNEIR